MLYKEGVPVCCTGRFKYLRNQNRVLRVHTCKLLLSPFSIEGVMLKGLCLVTLYCDLCTVTLRGKTHKLADIHLPTFLFPANN